MAMAVISLHPQLLPPSSKSQMLPILETPPRSMMLPLLPTPSAHTLLLQLSTMPGRADFVQRWDTYKNYKMSCSPASSTSSPSENSGSPGRADTCERWEARNKYKIPDSATSSSSSSDSGGSDGGADSVERWDSKKLIGMPLPTDGGRLQYGSNKRPPSRASSADRWDLLKRHCAEEKDNLPRTEETTPEKFAATTTTAAHKEVPRMPQTAFAGPSFYASPEPTMLPIPPFLLRAQ